MRTYTRQRFALNQWSNRTVVFVAGIPGIDNRLESTCYDPYEVSDRIQYLLREGVDPSKIRVTKERRFSLYPLKTRFHVAETTTRKHLLSTLFDRWEQS